MVVILKSQTFAISGQRLARLNMSTIETLRTEKNAELFFEIVRKTLSEHENVSQPELTRKRKRPICSVIQYIEGHNQKAEPHHPVTPANHYRKIYFEDIVLSSLKGRFEQPTYKVYASVDIVIIYLAKDYKS